MADYLARMEATVLAARDGMLQLRNENSKLKARIAGEVIDAGHIWLILLIALEQFWKLK